LQTQYDPIVQYKARFISVVSKNNWEYVNRNTSSGNIVSVLAITENKEVVLVEQFRIPVNKYVLECPAGLIDDGEEPLVAIKRELLEETGYISNNWKQIYTSPKSPGIISEIEYAFIATDCKKVEDGGGIENEKIVVQIVQLENLDNWLLGTMSMNRMVSSGIYAKLYHYNDLNLTH